ncbi:hypothetical protein PHJA_000102100 [Phtheirospermum japonicum]|uniref:Uncharacterized protein n=1 Tax=Phtheirospermum japonicum TaxID=374723 RepID=A0A830AZC9_9LAMI|nr:hypothetical protein PHJA_000102100 [Phtheirospermum japonicum]
MVKELGFILLVWVWTLKKRRNWMSSCVPIVHSDDETKRSMNSSPVSPAAEEAKVKDVPSFYALEFEVHILNEVEYLGCGAILNTQRKWSRSVERDNQLDVVHCEASSSPYPSSRSFSAEQKYI